MAKTWFAGQRFKAPSGYTNVAKGSAIPVFQNTAGVNAGATATQEYDPDVAAITTASKATQASATVDRQRALQEISGAREKALGEYGNISPEVIS